jgi:23S rRNA (adenine2503-C2)-methyltransferase
MVFLREKWAVRSTGAIPAAQPSGRTNHGDDAVARTICDRMIAPPMDAPSTLAAFAPPLPQEKARAALRRLMQGESVAPEWFRGHGMPLSREEIARLDTWSRASLTTQISQSVRSDDGSVRLVVKLRDGELVETVAMPVRAVCVSTQVGCAVACRFCASGLLGLKRNLTAQEIVEQLVHARRAMRIDRVVYMGMGEPSHNVGNVLEAVAWIKKEGAISPRKQTFSTIGSLAAFEKLARAEVQPSLALSLHSADETIRRRLVPNAAPDSLRDVVAAAGAYSKQQGVPVVFEWTLLAGINDRDEDVTQLVELVQEVRGYVNFIRWNPVAGMEFTPTSLERAIELREAVKAKGVLATIRASTGKDVDAACGQLRRRSIAQGR